MFLNLPVMESLGSIFLHLPPSGANVFPIFHLIYGSPSSSCTEMLQILCK